MRRSEQLILVLALVLLGIGYAGDRLNQWVANTQLPPLLSETSVEIRDRNADLLRVYTVADGRWRLTVTPDQVDARLRRYAHRL